jgi:hypothetical protein
MNEQIVAGPRTMRGLGSGYEEYYLLGRDVIQYSRNYRFFGGKCFQNLNTRRVKTEAAGSSVGKFLPDYTIPEVSTICKVLLKPILQK